MFAEWPPWLNTVGLVIGCYCFGSIPFGLLVGWLKGVDIRKHGSGNIGATNAGRVLGRGYGILVFVLDVGKGLAPVGFASFLLRHADEQLPDGGLPSALIPASGGGSTACLVLVALAAACVLGHMFPVYLKFKGGKGVATSLGVLLGIYPYYTAAGLITLGLWVLVTLATRYVSVGSVAAAVAFPIIFAVTAYARSEAWGGARQLWPLHLFGIVIAVLVVYRHRGNLRRLMEGVEPRIGTSRRRED